MAPRGRYATRCGDYLLCTFGGGFNTGIVPVVGGGSLSIPGSTAGGRIVPLDCAKRFVRDGWVLCVEPLEVGAAGFTDNGDAGTADWLVVRLCCAASAMHGAMTATQTANASCLNIGLLRSLR
jgi:hypothetical protein